MARVVKTCVAKARATKKKSSPGDNHARNCIPTHYFQLIYFPGNILAPQNPKPGAEQGTNPHLSDATEKCENMCPPETPKGVILC
jgi:hypothetical protein